MNKSLLPTFNNINITSENSAFPNSVTIIVAGILLNGLVALLALVGNTFVIWTVCARKPLKSAANYLIVSIAIADILMIMLYVPLLLMSLLNISWLFNNWSCKLFEMIPSLAYSITQISLVAVSIVWFKIIVCPSQMPLTKRNGILISIAIWAVNFFVTIPSWTYARAEMYESVVYCVSFWATPSYIEDTYFIFFTIWTYLFPVVWFICTYIIIMNKLFRTYSLVGRWHDDVDGLKHNKESVKMMIVVTAIQIICWFPVTVMQISSKFVNEIFFSEITLKIINWIAITSTMWKPIVYLAMSEKFRSNVKITCGWFPCIKPDDS